MEEETKRCPNCKRDIQASNFGLHEVHCVRNIVLCQKCKEPIARSELQAHIEELHVKEKCKLCEKEIERSLMEEHVNSCPQRPVPCPYCDLDFAHCQLTDHVGYCGARTEPCGTCARFIMLKDMERHHQTACRFPEQPKPVNRDPRPADGGMGAFQMDELTRMLDGTNTWPASDLPPARTRRRKSRGQAPPSSRKQPNKQPSRAARPTRADSPEVFDDDGYGPSPGPDRPPAPPPAPPPARGPPPPPAEFCSVRTLPSKSEIDALLAAQLASEDRDAALLAAQMTSQDRDAALVEEANILHYNESPQSVTPAEDDATLPCEFCDDLFPIDVLLHHQNACALQIRRKESNSTRSDDLDHLGSDVTAPVADQSERRIQDQGMGPETLNYFIDNMLDTTERPYENHNGFDDRVSWAEPEEPLMLPCEFCGELLSHTELFHHQNICQMNRSETPDIPPRIRDKPLTSPLAQNVTAAGPPDVKKSSSEPVVGARRRELPVTSHAASGGARRREIPVTSEGASGGARHREIPVTPRQTDVKKFYGSRSPVVPARTRPSDPQMSRPLYQPRSRPSEMNGDRGVTPDERRRQAQARARPSHVTQARAHDTLQRLLQDSANDRDVTGPGGRPQLLQGPAARPKPARRPGAMATSTRAAPRDNTDRLERVSDVRVGQNGYRGGMLPRRNSKGRTHNSGY